MLPQRIRYRLWNLALRLNPQPATYGVRTAASAGPGATDTFTFYNLLRVTYRELTLQELALRKAEVNDTFRVYVIYQADLDQAGIQVGMPTGAPLPAMTYTLAFSDGSTWTIESVKGVAVQQAWECTCRLEPNVAAVQTGISTPPS
jgi:hypothetical protein